MSYKAEFRHRASIDSAFLLFGPKNLVEYIARAVVPHLALEIKKSCLMNLPVIIAQDEVEELPPIEVNEDSPSSEELTPTPSRPVETQQRPIRPPRPQSIPARPASPTPRLFHAEEESAEAVFKKLPKAPTDTPDLNIPKRNPLMYELVQRNSLWWDSCDSEVSLEFDEYLSLDDPRTAMTNLMTINEGNKSTRWWQSSDISFQTQIFSLFLWNYCANLPTLKDNYVI